MKVNFTPSEKNMLEGQANKLAIKHGCSRVYVRWIITGKRNIDSELAKNIYKDLMALIDLLSPQPPKDEKNV